MISSPRLFFGIVIGLPFVLGAAVRIAGLRWQILIDDEVHALRVALGRTLEQIFSRYSIVDVSIPLTALDRVLLDLGVPLTEMTLRLPSLVAGLLALALIPWLLRERLSGPVLLLLGLLLALSPWLIFYSRFARPYMPVTLTAFLALALYRRFSSDGKWLDGLGYASFGALSIWLFFLSAPLVLAPALQGLFPGRDTNEEQKRDSRKWAWMALTAVIVLTLLLLAPLLDDIGRAFAWHVGPHPSAEPGDAFEGGFAGLVVNGLALLSGSTHWFGATLFWFFVARGAWLHRTLDRSLFRFCSFAVVFHLAVMTPAAGLRVSHLFPVAFARYLVVLLPFLYLWAALGLLAPVRATRSNAGRWAQPVVAALFLALWLGGGPYQAIASAGYHSSFAGSKQPFAGRSGAHGVVRGEEFYRMLAQAPAATVVLESPGDEHDSILRLYAANQRIHKHRVTVTEFPLVDGSRLAFRNMVRPGPTAILASDASHLVIHLALFDEVRERFGSTPRHLEPRARNHELLARQLARDLRDLWGPADREDEWIVAWNLDRLRAAGVPGI